MQLNPVWAEGLPKSGNRALRRFSSRQVPEATPTGPTRSEGTWPLALSSIPPPHAARHFVNSGAPGRRRLPGRGHRRPQAAEPGLEEDRILRFGLTLPQRRGSAGGRGREAAGNYGPPRLPSWSPTPVLTWGKEPSRRGLLG